MLIRHQAKHLQALQPYNCDLALRDPNISPVTEAGLEDVFLQEERQYGVVPLVFKTVKPNMAGSVVPKDILLLGADTNSGEIKLDSVSTEGRTTEELARQARDLIIKVEHPVFMDVAGVLTKTVSMGYPVISGVMTVERPETRTRFASLIVPNVYMNEVYDMIDMTSEHNTRLKDATREEASTTLSAVILNWAIERSIVV